MLQTIPDGDKWCVEFGAWDGIFACNSRNLIETKGFSAVLIEANSKKFAQLRRNYAHNANVFPVNAFVGFEIDDGLDTILADFPIPDSFDLLSIDVDGNDYHIWKAIDKYRPKAVVIEFNPTIPTELRFVQPADPSINQGSSLLSLIELGKEKGYELVSVLSCNAFFIDRRLYPRFEIEDNRPDTLRTCLSP
jgi:hypothetical protein